MIKNAEYVRRRNHLLQMTGADSVVILPAAQNRVRNSDVLFPYRQDSDFYYLTGFNEPDAVVVLLPGDREALSIMFCRERDPGPEAWDGPRVGVRGAINDYGMDEAFDIRELDQRLPGYLDNHDRVVYSMGHDTDFDQKVIGWLNELSGGRQTDAPEELVRVDHDLHEMRLYKSKAEISLMRKAAKVTVKAHTRAMQRCRPGGNEADLHAELLAEFCRSHCEPAYQSIVGAGANACILHYIGNNQPLLDGDLVLIDAGAEFAGYAADVTRTFPVNGKFSEEQKALYDIVLAAQESAIETVTPGNTHEDGHIEAVRVVTRGLVDLGILKGEVDALIEDESYADFYVHRTGHWLGLDVHDVGDYQIDGHSRVLEPGMVLTVEPGIYVRPHQENVDERWRGIGIRIEDDVLVTRDAPDVLSAGLPKTVKGIEDLMAT